MDLRELKSNFLEMYNSNKIKNEMIENDLKEELSLALSFIKTGDYKLYKDTYNKKLQIKLKGINLSEIPTSDFKCTNFSLIIGNNGIKIKRINIESDTTKSKLITDAKRIFYIPKEHDWIKREVFAQKEETSVITEESKISQTLIYESINDRGTMINRDVKYYEGLSEISLKEQYKSAINEDILEIRGILAKRYGTHEEMFRMDKTVTLNNGKLADLVQVRTITPLIDGEESKTKCYLGLIHHTDKTFPKEIPCIKQITKQ